MGRKKTTGKFETREELIDCVNTLRQNGSKNTEIADSCGISLATLHNLTKGDPRPSRKTQTKTTNSPWVSCWQKANGVTHIPFQGQIIKDLGTHLILRHNQSEVRVNKGACSKPFARP